MVRNYIKIALRNISRDRAYSLINILGLAVGFTCILLIAAFVNNDLSYDLFHSKKELVYRIVNDHTDEDSGQLTHAAYTNAPVAGLIDDNITGVARVARIHEKQGLLWVDGEEKYVEKNFVYADSTFFEMLDFDFVRGSQETALTAPFSLVLTESTALRYFGEQNPIGQTLNNRDDNGINQLVVTGVIKDIPWNSHFEADMICSMATLQKTQPWNFYWYFPPMYTYIEFQTVPDVTEAEDQITSLIQSNVPDGYGIVDYQLQRLDDIYLHSQREGEFRPTGNYTTVMIFVTIAAFILLLAAVNFINLTTARSIKKAKEVGIRKVMGAYRKQLLLQFLSESLLTTVLSFVISIGLLLLTLNLFEGVVEKNLPIQPLINVTGIFIAFGVLVVVGVLAGLYPAIYLSSFHPSRVLKQGLHGQAGKVTLRKVLVVFQFIVSCLLILGTIVIHQQMNFMMNKRLGFDKEQVLVIPLEETEDQQNYKLLKEQIQSHSSVINVSMTSGVPGKEGFYDFSYNIGTDPESLGVNTLGTDEDFMVTYGVELSEGRNFSREITSDENSSFLVNQAMVERFGWDEPLGQEITLHYHVSGPVSKKGQVVGVVEDFHYESLYHEIEPLAIHILPPSYFSQYLSVRLQSGTISQSVDFLEDTWAGFNANRPFEYFFLDDDLNKNYQSEQKLSRMLSLFSGLAIFVSCLGLIGLVAFTTEQKTKEIGIRKVLGARVGTILEMISKEYVLLIGIANVVAFPIAWMVLKEWLNGFAYRTELHWSVFAATAIILLGIALLSVSALAFKAAKTDPVKSLRHE